MCFDELKWGDNDKRGENECITVGTGEEFLKC